MEESMNEDDARGWAASIIIDAVRWFMKNVDTYDLTDDEAERQSWSDETLTEINWLIDTATLDMTVDWPMVQV